MKNRYWPRLLVLTFIHFGTCSCAEAQQIVPKTLADRLLVAVMADDHEHVAALLRAGVSPNTPNAFQLHPLIWTAGWGRDVSLIKLLLNGGANVEGPDQLGNTPLLAASAAETYDTGVDARIAEITLLLDRGANLKAMNSQGETALMRAMQMGHHRIVRLLFDHGADINSTATGPGRFTRLDCAAFANDTDRVMALLKSGADVNRTTPLGTPLILASEGGSTSTLQALLDAGANVNARVPQQQFGGLGTALLIALYNGNVDAAKLLVAHGADVNTEVKLNGIIQYTPLTLAFAMRDMPPDRRQETNAEADARHSQIDGLIGQLLDKGANVNVVASNYQTPLVQAIRRDRGSSVKQVDWVKPLLDRGADVKVRLEYGGSALHVAIQNRPDDTHLAALLLDHGADIDLANGPEGDVQIQDLTPLMCATTQRHIEMAKFLLQRGARAECYDRARKTPLHWAAYYGQLDLVKLLLAHGANVNAQDITGQTAVMLARKGNHPDVVTFLTSQGGVTPELEVARRNALRHVVVTLSLTLLPGSKEEGQVTFGVNNGTPSPALTISRNGKQIAQPVTFDELLTSTSLWAPAELNDNRYQIGRRYYSPDSYHFFGLVTVKSGTYLGVFWYSPAASAENQVADFVFGLRVAGDALELEVVSKTDANSHLLTVHSEVPRLERSAEGDLIRIDWDGRYRYLPNGQWNKTKPPP